METADKKIYSEFFTRTVDLCFTTDKNKRSDRVIERLDREITEILSRDLFPPLDSADIYILFCCFEELYLEISKIEIIPQSIFVTKSDLKKRLQTLMLGKKIKVETGKLRMQKQNNIYNVYNKLLKNLKIMEIKYL